MKRSLIAATISMLASVALLGGAAVAPVQAGKDNPGEDRPKNRPKGDDANKDPVVQGLVVSTSWSDSSKPGQKTATIVVWNEAINQGVNVYGDDPTVRAAIVSGEACVGRFVVVVGDRIDTDALQGRSIQVYTDKPCTATLDPGGGGAVTKSSAASPTATPKPASQQTDQTNANTTPDGSQNPDSAPTDDSQQGDTSNQGDSTQPAGDSGPQPQTGPGLVSAAPADIILRLEDLGKEIKQLYVKPGSDNTSKWSEVRYERDPKRIDAGWGPIRIVNRVYVATDIAAAQTIYQTELGKQSKMPEAKDPVGDIFGVNDVDFVGDDEDTTGACNAACGDKTFSSVHRRTVFRFQNAVAVIYFWGGRDSATSLQMNEWLALVRGRM